MEPNRSSLLHIIAIFMATLLVLVSNKPCMGQLTPSFYSTTCPGAVPNVTAAVRAAISAERRMAASLLRLHFHDCFVAGCDASVLLDGGEKNAFQNSGSLNERAFTLVDDIKSRLEGICPGVVSCADILAIAARDSSFEVGGPSWTVKLGRRDSSSASQSQAENDLPGASADLSDLISLFGRKGFNAKEMVALSGSHTIGQAQCVTFRTRIYNDTNIDAGFATTRRGQCPANGGDSNLAPLDLVTPNTFDNNYYRNLIEMKGLLKTDQVLFNNGSTDDFVREYSNSGSTFSADFAAAMVKMGDMDPLTGSSGQIRRNCRLAN